MANIFKQNLDITQNPNRNNHDLTHKVHGTYKMGLLYPFLCKPVVPTDSFRIDTACGFQFMPMPFPTQSNIRVIFHYFYVRNKNLWSNWENWLQGLEEHTPPYINQTASFYKTGSLADFLDIPTTLVGSRSESLVFPLGFFGNTIGEGGSIALQYAFYNPALSSSRLYLTGSFNKPPLVRSVHVFNGNLKGRTLSSLSSNFLLCKLNDLSNDTFNRSSVFSVGFIGSNTPLLNLTYDSAELPYAFADDSYSIAPLALDYSKDNTSKSIELYISPNDVESFNNSLNVISERFAYVYPLVLIQYNSEFNTSTIYIDSASYNFPSVNSDSVVDISDTGVGNPYYNDIDNYGEDTIKVSALPFRAYESIYRAYYANSVLQPLEINGQKKFNRYNTDLGDGADNTDYHLFKRNWELDAYTSCLPSPQQGNAPLVGMNVLGEVTIQDPDTGAVTIAQTEIDGENVNLVVTSPIQSVEHGRTLVNLSNAGISIADLRQTNNLTRFLEQSIRSGYRYVDFIKGHFGNEPKYSELDMPEFLGGFSQRVDVNMISNTNGDVPIESDVKLGSYAGQARAFGGSEHGITRYFDDFGWIVGIMCIVPDGAYSQLLPKHFNMNNRLDYYFPEFSEIGLQPVTYEEVAPVQSHHEYLLGRTEKKLTDTFGYQRPNHDLVWYPDTVHGEMRLSLKDTIINRVFANRPELGDEFLTINPDETNNIFSVTEEDNDVVIGQIVVKITAKRPVPRIVIPGLGR